MRGLVVCHRLGVHVERALLIRGCGDIGPFLRFGVQINLVAMLVSDDALRTLERQESLIGNLALGVQIGLNLRQLCFQNRIAAFGVGVIGFLEGFKSLLHFHNRIGGGFDINVRHGTSP